MNDRTRVWPMVGSAFLVLLGIVLLAYQYSRPRAGSIVLPGGITYLGPTPPAQPAKPTPLFFADASVPWTTITSAMYGYTFSVPQTLTLEPFLTEEFDAYAITWNNVAKETNVLIGVEDLTRDDRKAAFVQKPKKDYIESFWARQYNLTGVRSIEAFTNAHGLKGYRVTFQTADGISPYDDVFFEVPGKPNLLIHLSHAILERAVFDRIVDSVAWNE